MLKLFKTKRCRAQEMKAQLNKISSIKLDLSIYPSHNPSKRSKHSNIVIKDNSIELLDNKNKLNSIYENIQAITLGDLNNLNSLSLFELKQIMKQLDTVPYSTYNDKESLNQIKFLISVWKKIQQIIIEKAVKFLNEAHDLHNIAYKMIMEGQNNLPIESIEEIKEELEACLNNVDFSRNTDIRLDINNAINDMNNILSQKPKTI